MKRIGSREEDPLIEQSDDGEYMSGEKHDSMNID